MKTQARQLAEEIPLYGISNEEELYAAHQECTFCYVRNDGFYKVYGFDDGSLLCFDQEDWKWKTVRRRKNRWEDETGKYLATLKGAEPVYWTRYDP